MNEITETRVNRINALHEGIRSKMRLAVEDAIEIGRMLEEQKAELKHGDFLPWIKMNCAFSQQTASNYMRLYAYSDKLPSVGNLQDAYNQIEQIEAREKEEKRREQQRLISERERTGEKPQGWTRATEYEFQKLRDDAEYEQRKSKAFEAQQKAAEQERQRRAEEQKRNGAEWEAATDFLRQAAETLKKNAHLNLSSYAENMNQQEMFTAIEQYINSFETVSAQLEATHNLIKKIKMIAAELQQKSIA
jgi:hypothetical protein